MNKDQFLAAVRQEAVSVPQHELEKMLEYYEEMIDEATEEGLCEEEAIARLGTWDEICEQIGAFRIGSPPVSSSPQCQTPPKQASEPKSAERRRVNLPVWAVVLLILTSPVWGAIVLSLGIAVFAVIASLVVVGGALVISLFAVVLCLAVVGVVGIPTAFVLLFTGSAATGLLSLGCGLVCIGFTILGWFLCITFAKFVAVCVKALFGGIGRVIGR